MKYSIEGFSQEKLLEFNLDIIDAVLLRWFSDFAATGGMKRLLRNGKIYFWLYYPAVVKEFPTMKIKNPKSIACRFNKYVECGLLDRTVEKTQKGTYTFYAIIDTVFRSLIYNPNNLNPQSSLKCSALNDPSTNIYPSTTANINKTNNISSSEQIIFLKNQIQEYFDIACFSSDFFDKLSCFLIAHKIYNDIVSEYLKFVYTKVIEKKPNSVLNYFYTVITQPYFSIQFFQNHQDKEQKLKPLKMHICPACKNEYNGSDGCVFCELPKNKEGECDQVIFHREIYNLNGEDKKLLKKELSELYLIGFEKKKPPEKTEIQAVYGKYGIKQP